MTDVTNHNRKRLIWMLVGLTCIFVLLIVRLAYVQLIATESFSRYDIDLIQSSIEQRQQQMIVHSGRGDIQDRDGESLTGETENVLVLYPIFHAAEVPGYALHEAAQIAGIRTDELVQRLETIEEPQVYETEEGRLSLTPFQLEQINALNIPGVQAVPYDQRGEPDTGLAPHLVGYLGENEAYIQRHFASEMEQGLLHEQSKIGISGLEQTFEPFLMGAEPSRFTYYVDGQGRPLHGLGLKYIAEDNPFYPLNVKTTLNSDLQQTVEQIMAEQVNEGVALVLDAQTSEILALDSRPHPATDEPWSDNWTNKAVQRYPAGSIFKIVVAAAALEKGIVAPHDMFVCHGQHAETDLSCWLEEGHGKLNFIEAFAQSCNIVFGELAEEIGPDELERYAEKLGLLDRNGWQTEHLHHLQSFEQLNGEEVGQVFDADRTRQEKEDRQWLQQTGIGQLDVQLTPLAVANMVATLVREGEKQQVRAVDEITYQTGGTFASFDKQELPGENISAYTAYQVKKLMHGVTEFGTAKQIQDDPQRLWQAGGKTGTAEAKSSVGTSHTVPEAREDVTHQWFAGFYPQHEPQYVIVVLQSNRPAGTPNESAHIFAHIVDWLEVSMSKHKDFLSF